MKSGLTRRGFWATMVVGASVKLLLQIAAQVGGKQILTLVWDKSIDAIGRLVPQGGPGGPPFYPDLA